MRCYRVRVRCSLGRAAVRVAGRLGIVAEVRAIVGLDRIEEAAARAGIACELETWFPPQLQPLECTAGASTS
jgi:hypothetical protein